MVRLNPTDGEPRNGPNAHIVDHLLGQKRARPNTNSLDYHHKPGKERSVILPKPQKPPPSQEEKASSTGTTTRATAASSSSSSSTTRARSGGIPPRKLELSDLAGLTEQEILQALHDDPDLAQAAADQLPPPKKPKRSSSGGGSSNSKPKRSPVMEEKVVKGRRVAEKVPYLQWTILLGLVALGLYQLYKSMRGPGVKDGKKKGKKKNKDAGRSLKDDLVDKVAREIGDAVLGADKGSKGATKKKAKAKNSTKVTPTKSSTKPAKTVSASEAADDSHQEAVDANRGAPSLAPSSDPLNSPTITESMTDDDQGGWQTVGEKKDNGEKVQKSPELPSLENERPASTPAKVVTPNVPKVSTSVLKAEAAEDLDKAAPAAAAAAADPDPDPSTADGVIDIANGEADAEAAKTATKKAVKKSKKQPTAAKNKDTPETSELAEVMSSEATNGAAATNTELPEIDIKESAMTSNDKANTPENGENKVNGGSEKNEPVAEAADSSKDAALAQMLQSEEEAMVTEAPEPAASDEWAEVNTKKKRKA